MHEGGGLQHDEVMSSDHYETSCYSGFKSVRCLNVPCFYNLIKKKIFVII